jgi:hypothetical protein
VDLKNAGVGEHNTHDEHELLCNLKIQSPQQDGKKNSRYSRLFFMKKTNQLGKVYILPSW